MIVEFESLVPHVAVNAATECAMILQRYGVAATYVPGAACVEIPGTEESIYRLSVAVIQREARETWSIATVLQQLVDANVIPASVVEDEVLLLDRLVDLGYL